MHSTKTEILAHLKRNDGSTVDGIASSLNLAPMTVRQHLTALERDRAVRVEEVRRPTGRPHYRYLLTEDGHRRLSDGYDRLVALLIEQTGVLEPNGAHTADDRRERLFRAAAKALAAQYLNEMRGLSAAGQAERAVAILRQHGGFTEFHELEGAHEIRDFGCVYRETVSRSGPCAWHETFLSTLLQVEIRAAESPSDCAVCCRYIVHTQAAATTAAKEQG